MPERILRFTDLDRTLPPNGKQPDYLWRIDAMRLRSLCIFLMLCFAAIEAASATTFYLPENPDDTVITQYPDNKAFTHAIRDETLLDIAARFSLGQTEIVRLNQKADRWLVKKARQCVWLIDAYFRIRLVEASS